jgi:hypothetical protein
MMKFVVTCFVMFYVFDVCSESSRNEDGEQQSLVTLGVV